jgi:hypothetical protein
VLVELPVAEEAAPAPQQLAAAATASSSRERSPLPGEALTTPLIQLLEDQRAANPAGAPPGFGQGSPNPFAKTELAFGAEPIDEPWARGQEANLLARISQLQGLALLDLRVECRSTMCRLQMSHPVAQDGTAFRTVVQALGMEPQWAMSLAGRNGSFNSIAYLWREGHAAARPALASGADQ